jgi:uncharacterized membrane protein
MAHSRSSAAIPLLQTNPQVRCAFFTASSSDAVVQVCYTAAMLKAWTVVIALHAIIATATITLGTFQVLRMIRGDRLHKAVGRTWASLMLFVSISGLFIIRTHQPIDIFLGGLAVWTIITYQRRRLLRSKREYRCPQGIHAGQLFWVTRCIYWRHSRPDKKGTLLLTFLNILCY